MAIDQSEASIVAIDQSEARRQGPDEQQQTITFYILSAKITPGALLLNEPLMVSQHEIRHKQSLIISFPQFTSICNVYLFMSTAKC